MSEPALLQAVAAELISQFSFSTDQCQVNEDDGRPPEGFMGNIYVAVHPGQIGGCIDTLDYDVEKYEFLITVSAKTGWVPHDWRGPRTMLQAGQYLVDHCRKIRAHLCKLPKAGTVVAAANTILEAEIGAGNYGIGGFIKSGGMDRPVTRRGDWFGADDTREYLGSSRTMHFFGPERQQPRQSVSK